MCALSLEIDKWSIYRFKVEKHEAIEHDVFCYNAFQGIRFGNKCIKLNMLSLSLNTEMEKEIVIKKI